MRYRILFSLLALLPAAAFAQAPPPAVDPDFLAPAWSPYLAGGLIGVLVWFTFLFSDRALGGSGGFAKLAGLFGLAVAPRLTRSLKTYAETPPKIDWEVTLVIGVIIGAFIAAYTGGEFTGRWLPPMWVERFGDSLALRLGVAFLGGLLMAFGARLAGGCTSGHGISGSLQLSVGSFVTVFAMFVGGILVANLLYRM